MRFRTTFKRFSRQTIEAYEGFELIVSLSFLLGLVYLNIVWIRPNVPVGPWDSKCLIVLRYCAAFWSARVSLLFGATIFWIALLPLRGLRPLHATLVRHCFVRSAYSVKTWRRVNISRKLIAGAVLILLLVTIPLLDLYYSEWFIVVAGLAPIPFGLAFYFSAFGWDLPVLYRRRPIAKLTYESKSLNVAGIGTISIEAKNLLAEYDNLATRYGSLSPETRRALSEGFDGWGGLATFFRQLSDMLGGVDAGDLVLFDRTTDAVRHAIAEIKRFDQKNGIESRHWIYSDADYPGVLGVLQSENEAERQRTKCPVGEAIWEGASQAEIEPTLEQAIREASKPCAVLLSHVYYATGRVLDLQRIVDRLRGFCQTNGWEPGDLIIIVDGAQAAGQLPLNVGEWFNAGPLSEEYPLVAFYATCTHKWVLGRPTLGVLWENARALSSTQEKSSTALTRSLSRLRDIERFGREEWQGTVNMEPYLSAGIALDDLLSLDSDGKVSKHGHALACMFRDGVQSRQIGRPIGNNQHGVGSIVTVDLSRSSGNRGEEWVKEVKNQLENAPQLVRAAPNSEKIGLRYGFHYFHSDSDVIQALDSLEEAIRTVNLRRWLTVKGGGR